MRKVEVSIADPKAFVAAAACHIDANDSVIFAAFLAAEEDIEEGEAGPAFALFVALLAQKGIVVTTMEASARDRVEEAAYGRHTRGNPSRKRGIAL